MPDAHDAARRGTGMSTNAERAWNAVGEFASSDEVQSRLQAARLSAALATGVRRQAPRWPVALAACLALISIGLSAVLLTQSRTLMFRSDFAHPRTVVLSDATLIALDRDSAVAVTYDRRSRKVVLLRGQAEFDVAKNPDRPFSVYAGGRRVTATGTLFNVDLAGDQLVVSLIRGGVSVSSEVDRWAPIQLTPMQRLQIDRSTGETRRGTFDRLDVEAWRMGRLIFDVVPLEHAVARVNRYSKRKIVVADARQVSGEISGVFKTGDAAAFATAAASQLSLDVRVRGDDILLVQH